MNDNVEIIRSNKGGMKVIHRGYMYTVHKKRQGGGIRWRCTQRSLHCKGSISTGNGPPTVNMPHNHIPDPHSVALARCRQLEDFPDINSLLETEYDEIKDSMPLQQRMLLIAPPQVQIPSSSSESLHSQPLSPTKLKVTRQVNKPKPIAPETSNLSDEVCLRWNSHHSNMQTVFPQLLQKEQYVDVTIMAEGITLKCHRMILSSCSAYFEEILNDITPLQHPVIILKGIPFWILKALTDFMYVGEINIDQNKLPELLDIAELLKVKGLAGKSSNGEQQQNDKNESPLINNGKMHEQQSEEKPAVAPPVAAKVEEIPQCDPLELFEPKFQDDNDSKSKENKLLSRKLIPRKFRKRKSSEAEKTSSPPLFPMRRGTRSRPNVKVPKYYDYEDIVRPTTASDIQPFSPIVNIKSEPIDVEENEIPPIETVSMESENLDTKHSLLSNIGLNPKPPEKNKDAVNPVNLQSVNNDNTDQASSPYKIKIKCLASLSDNPYQNNTQISDNNILFKCSENVTSSNELYMEQSNNGIEVCTELKSPEKDTTLNDSTVKSPTPLEEMPIIDNCQELQDTQKENGSTEKGNFNSMPDIGIEQEIQ